MSIVAARSHPVEHAAHGHEPGWAYPGQHVERAAAPQFDFDLRIARRPLPLRASPARDRRLSPACRPARMESPAFPGREQDPEQGRRAANPQARAKSAQPESRHRRVIRHSGAKAARIVAFGQLGHGRLCFPAGQTILQEPTRAGLKMANIALVDDDRNILASVSMLLEQEGYNVRTYSDGASAYTALS